MCLYLSFEGDGESGVLPTDPSAPGVALSPMSLSPRGAGGLILLPSHCSLGLLGGLSQPPQPCSGQMGKSLCREGTAQPLPSPSPQPPWNPIPCVPVCVCVCVSVGHRGAEGFGDLPLLVLQADTSRPLGVDRVSYIKHKFVLSPLRHILARWAPVALGTGKGHLGVVGRGRRDGPMPCPRQSAWPRQTVGFFFFLFFFFLYFLGEIT